MRDISAPSRRRRPWATSFRRRKLSVVTCSFAIYTVLLSVMMAALLYVYLRFPEPADKRSNNGHGPYGTVTYKHVTPWERTSAVEHNNKKKRLRLPTHEALGIHYRYIVPPDDVLGVDVAAAAGADGGELEPAVALFPVDEAKHPPRVYTCRCYPQVKYAFAQRGFRRKADENDYAHAWIIWKTGTDIAVNELQHWQRPNHFPGERLMDRKDAMYQVLRSYATRTHRPLDFVPETFLLYDERDRTRFLQRLADGGMGLPWVMKRSKASRGRGVSMLGPESKELETLRDELITGPAKMGNIVQSYIRNEWTFQGHKCDLRVYVLVASVDPLIVYYHDGIVRTAVGLHDEDNFDEIKAHLTNVSQNKFNRTQWEPVKTFVQLEEELLAYARRDDVVVETDHPARHVRNQIKQILGFVFAAFKSRMTLDKVPVDNAFSLMGADFVIDKDLKVWLLEMQLGPQLVGDNHKEKIDILQDVLTTTIDVVEEVFHKQLQKEPLLPLEKAGKFELVYFDQSYRFQFADE